MVVLKKFGTGSLEEKKKQELRKQWSIKCSGVIEYKIPHKHKRVSRKERMNFQITWRLPISTQKKKSSLFNWSS